MPLRSSESISVVMSVHLAELLSRATKTPDLGPAILAVTLSLTIAATLLVLVRIYYRWSIVQLGWDDLCAGIALVCYFRPRKINV